ncbi:MAG: cytochrome c oxidase subunit 3 [Gemmatimonadales bacterium]
MTSLAVPVDLRPSPHANDPVRSFGWWAMACTCATEASLFAYFIASNFYLDLRSASWPPPGIARPKLLIPLLMTATLLSSSAVLAWGERGIRRNDRRRLVIGICGTMTLATAFLVMFALEYHDKLGTFRPSGSAYASIFYVTTSLHCSHVLAGMTLLGFTLWRTLRGHFSAERHVGVAVTTLYWHFVGAIWLAILTTFYLAPHLT